MMFSHRYIGLIALASATSDIPTPRRVCEYRESLGILSLGYIPGTDEFDDMIACQLERDFKRFNPQVAREFVDWKKEHSGSSIMRSVCGVELNDSNPYKSVLENMLKFNRFVSRPLIRPQTNVFCLLVNLLIANEGSMIGILADHIKGTVEKVWRNFLTEYFARELKPFYRRDHFFLMEDDGPYFYNHGPTPLHIIMQLLAARCDVISDTYFYASFRLAPDFQSIEWQNMGTFEIHYFCERVRGRQYAPLSWATYLKFARSRKGKFSRTIQQPPSAVKICYYDLKPSSESSGKWPMYDASWGIPDLSESKLSTYIAEKLMMNKDELTEFCRLVKEFNPPVTDAKMIELALTSISRQSDLLFNKFRLFTGEMYPETIESRFYDFIGRASSVLDISVILTDWEEVKPLALATPMEEMCGSLVEEPPRSDASREIWIIITRLAPQYPTWEPIEKKEFCDAVRSRYWVHLGTEEYLRKFEALLTINRNTPHTNELCGRITTPFPPGFDIPVFDGLVAEAGRDKACGLIELWNTRLLTDANDLLRRIQERARALNYWSALSGQWEFGFDTPEGEPV